MPTEGPGTPSTSRPLPRFRRDAAAAPEIVLVSRDLALLEDVWRYGVLSTSQIEALRLGDPDPAHRFVSRFTLTRRLKLLFHNRYLRRLPRAIPKGSLEPVYVLDAEGARTLSLHHGEVSAKAPSRLPKSAALDHLLGIAQVRLSLSLPDRSDGTPACELAEWLPGDRVRFRVAMEGVGQRRQTVSVVPDGGAIIRAGGRRHYAFIEVDRSSEPQRTLTAKCRSYSAYWSSGGFAADWSVPRGMGFWVLFVVPSARRLETVLKAIAAAGGPRMMFKAALETDVRPGRIGEAVWLDGQSGKACRAWELG